MSTTEKYLFLSDFHIPFQNEKAIKTMEKQTKDMEFDIIFNIGDIIDLYTLSDFKQDPLRANSLQSDIDKTHKYLSHQRDINAGSKIVYIKGNHEDRLIRWLWKHPEVSSLDSLSFDNLMGLEELKIDYEGKYRVLNKKFMIEHGSICRQQSGYTARAMIEKRGLSGISGHTHRLGQHYLSNMSGTYQWVENGCMCNLNPEYILGKPNWQNGYSIGEYNTKTGKIFINQYPLTDKKR